MASTGTATNDYLQVDSEIMQIAAGGGTTNLTVTRGQLGTTAASQAICVRGVSSTRVANLVLASMMR
ncbi:MAG TPA: hypothetical protein VEE85_00505 [Candidatus Bathyarchaeia archaeon]|nr:hypothetical protein [Candidatus Bathyarchaeia archaeon]